MSFATDADGLVPNSTDFPLHGLNKDAILDLLRRVLFSPHAVVQSIAVNPDTMSVAWRGAPDVPLLEDVPPEDTMARLRSLPMEEVDGASPAAAIGAAVLQLEAAGLSPVAAVVGIKSRLWRWLGADDLVERPSCVGGGPVHAVKGIDSDELYLIGGPSRTSTLQDATASVRIVMVGAV